MIATGRISTFSQETNSSILITLSVWNFSNVMAQIIMVIVRPVPLTSWFEKFLI